MWPAFCVLSGFGFCLVKTGLLTGFAYQIDLHRTLIARFDQQMAGFGAEMGHVDDGCGIIRAHCNLCAGLQRRQSFAQFQHGEGAQEARGIKVLPLLDGAGISTMSQLAKWTVESDKILVF